MVDVTPVVARMLDKRHTELPPSRRVDAQTMVMLAKATTPQSRVRMAQELVEGHLGTIADFYRQYTEATGRRFSEATAAALAFTDHHSWGGSTSKELLIELANQVIGATERLVTTSPIEELRREAVKRRAQPIHLEAFIDQLRELALVVEARQLAIETIFVDPAREPTTSQLEQIGTSLNRLPNYIQNLNLVIKESMLYLPKQ